MVSTVCKTLDFQVAILILLIRRHPAVSGGEFGGPKWIKILSSSFFFFLWIVFVALSALESYKVIEANF
jgi:solute carrier family 8 (sodium/calcium exchanger)